MESNEIESEQGGWRLLADSPDALRAVVELLNRRDKLQAFRQVCRAARYVVDQTVASLHLEFKIEVVGEDEDAPEFLDWQPFFRTEEQEEAYYARRLHESFTFKHFPGTGKCWPNALTVCIENSAFSKITLELLDNASLRWRYLETLKLSECRFGRKDPSETFSALTLQFWPCLQNLELIKCGLSSTDLSNLAQLHAPNLQELDLSENKLTSLMEFEHAAWPLLNSIALCRNTDLEVTTESLNILCSIFPQLDDLDVSGVPLLARDVAVLSKAPWPALTWLTLSQCGLTDSALAPFASPDFNEELNGYGDQHSSLERVHSTSIDGKESGLHLYGFRNLERLDLSGNQLHTSTSIKYLCSAARYLPKLTSLDISSNAQLRGDALTAFKNSFWPRLETFEACNMVISTPSIEGLTAAGLPRLRFLILGNCIMSWEAVDQLAAGQWPRLRKLDLGGYNGIHIRRAGPSLQAACWPRLKLLILRKSPVRMRNLDRQGLLLLRENWPNVKVRCDS